MSKLERLAMMTPKSVQIGFIPGGFGGLSSADIANACHGLPNYVFKLLVAKYCFAERDTSKQKEALTLEAIYLISRSLLESGDIVKDFFSKNGYQVIRSAASKGPADLVAFKKGEILFIQCKIGNFHNIREWNLLVDIAESVGAKPIFATIDEQRKIAFWNMREKDGSRRSVLDSPYVITELRSQPAKTKSEKEFKGGKSE